jgi:O-antigen ligase
MMVCFGLWAMVTTLPWGNTTHAAQHIAKLVVQVILIINLIRERDRYRTFVTALLLLTTYLAGYSLHLYFTGQAMQQGEFERSVTTGIFNDPNDLAATIVAGLALALARVARSQGMVRNLYLGMATLFVWAILMTNSRGGMLALLVVTGLFFFTFVKKKALAITLAAVLFALFFAVAPARMRTFDSSETSANSRFWFWDNGIRNMIDNPILGVGYDRFVEINDGLTAHNSFVLCFTELGLPGYFFWMGVLYYAYKRRPKDLPEPEDDPDAEGRRKDIMGARLALTGFLTASFFLSRTYIPISYIFICLPIVAEIASNPTSHLLKIPSEERWKDYRRIAAICVGSIILIKLIAYRLM